jgi:hypothetical protein
MRVSFSGAGSPPAALGSTCAMAEAPKTATIAMARQT